MEKKEGYEIQFAEELQLQSMHTVNAPQHHMRVTLFVLLTLSVFLCTIFISPHNDVRNLTVRSPSYTATLIGAISSESIQSNATTSAPTSSSCTCPAVVTMPDCSNTDKAFLGGVDVVEYWSLDDDATGVEGLEKHSATRNGYTFYFKDKHNLALFEKKPDKYMPKFGGFCSWAVSGEYCPTYPWAADCLGPSGNWGVWTIKRGKLFFFLKDTAKDLFLEDVDTYIAAGEERWAIWFPDETSYTQYNTGCYFLSADSSVGGTSLTMSAGKNGTVGGTEGLALLKASDAATTTSATTTTMDE